MPKLKKVKKLYHCTFPTRLDAILAEGLDPNKSWDHLVYMSPKPEVAASFLALRCVETIPGEFIEADGHKYPKVRVHNKLTVLEIDATQLDWSRMQEGWDHSPAFFGPDPVYCYKAMVPPWAFTKVMEYEIPNPPTVTYDEGDKLK